MNVANFMRDNFQNVESNLHGGLQQIPEENDMNQSI